MIKEIFYNEGRTYIKDTKGVEITTDDLTLAGAFDLAFSIGADFDYDIVDNDYDIRTMDRTLISYFDGHNRSIINFFNQCTENGIFQIIPTDSDTFGMIGVRKVINNIIDDYSSDKYLYNIEAYGTDTYIAKVVYDDLKAINDNIKHDTRIIALLKTIQSDDYDLDEFLKLLKLLPKDSDENIIKDFKERFEKDYDETSEALEWHIETLVNFGGDSTHKIYKAMIEVINDILNNAPSTNKKGMIEYLREVK